MKITRDTFTPRFKRGEAPSNFNPAVIGILAILLCALAFWQLHVQHTDAEEKILAGSNADMYMYHLPVRDYGFSQLRAGKMPLWNPYTNSGMPFLATYQAALFYPMNFPHWFLRADTAISLIYLLHLFLAGVFMYFWARELGCNHLAAVFAGVGYMLCAFVSYILVWPHIILCHTWIPLVFLFIRRTFLRARWTDPVYLGVVLACQFLAGYMQGFVYTLYGAFAYLLFLSVVELTKREKDSARFARSFALTLAGLLLIPALLTAIQWIPTFLLSGLSTRPPGGLSREAILITGSLSPATFFAALVNPESFKWVKYTLYPGALTLLMAAFAFVHFERWRELVFFSLLAIGSALLAFGSHTPLFGLFMYVPTGDWFRLPNRLLVLTAFSLVTLGGIGFNYLLEEVIADNEQAVKSAGRYAGFIALCGAFMLLLPKGGAIYVLILLLGCLLCVRVRSKPALGVLAVLLIGFDLTLHVMNPVTYPWITREVFPELKEEKEFLRENVGGDRVHILHRKYDWKNFQLNSNFGMVERIRETSGYESLALQRYAEFCAYLEAGDLPSYLIPFTGAFRWTSESVNPRLLNLLGARLIVDDPGRDLYPEKNPPSMEPKGLKLKKVFSGELNIYENPDALPRAFYTKKIEVIKDKGEVLKRLADPKFDYKNTIVLEEEPEPLASASDKPAGPAEVIVREHGEGAIGIVTTIPDSGFIFVNDMFVPGWRATVDGEDAKLYRADYLFMAISVKPGKHVIELVYRPAEYRAGRWITLLSMVVFSFGLAFDFVHRRAKSMAPWEKGPLGPGPKG